MKRAFTTIELLVATALAVMLMAGVLSVVGSIRLDPAASEPRSGGAWPSAVVDLLRLDLTHAKSMQQRGNTLTLVGYSSLFHEAFEIGERPDSKPPQHRPVTIEYSVKNDGVHSWLVRRQTNLDELTNRNTWSELVGCGVLSFQLKPIDIAVPPDSNGNWLEEEIPVPDRIRLVMQIDGDSDMDQTIIIR